jgi:hypothetical protein
MTAPKYFCTAEVEGREFQVVDPNHFFSGPSARGGRGLFCRVSLEPGDLWWAHDLSDPRFVCRVIPWEEYKTLKGAEKATAEILCYVDPVRRALIICTEPFCRVNHGRNDEANSGSDDALNSLITSPVEAGEEILISYDYEAVVSVLWKFPELRARFESAELEQESLLLSPVLECPRVLDFLRSL